VATTRALRQAAVDAAAAAATAAARLEDEAARLRELVAGQAGCLDDAATRRRRDADTANESHVRLEAVMERGLATRSLLAQP
jgi:hypothetical protein